MAINVSVQHNGGFLPDIVLLTQCYFHRGTRLNVMTRVCLCSLHNMMPPKLWHYICDMFPLTGGCSEGLDTFRLFFKQLSLGNSVKCHEEVLSLQSMIPPKRFDISPSWLGDAQKV